MNIIDPVFLTEEIRHIEQTMFALPNPPDLMEKAGKAAAEIVKQHCIPNRTNQILVLAGPGNNGGDAFVAARYLKQWGHTAIIIFDADPMRLPPDAQKAKQIWLDHGGTIETNIPNNQHYDLVIDGLFGIGSRHDRPVTGHYLEWINTVNAMRKPIIALDIPSGLGSDTGSIHGNVIHATTTVTFIGLKPGLLTQHGPQYCGKSIVCNLDLDPATILPPHAWAINRGLADTLLPPQRTANSHKGSFGSVGILGGNTGMTGAAILAGRAALHLGAGRIYLGMHSPSAPDIDIMHPELMIRTPSALFELNALSCMVIGPGMGINETTYNWLDRALDSQLPLVLDADALNHIALHNSLANTLKQRNQSTILTPHPMEAARLLDTDVSSVQSDRLTAATQLSEKFNCLILLKGAGSIYARPDGTCFFNTSGNPGLSSAGTGDVLSGMIGALIAQGLKPDDALLLAVYLHGAAADEQLKQNCGPIGMTASEIFTTARLLLNRWIYNKHHSDA